jgi:hypothetical protein
VGFGACRSYAQYYDFDCVDSLPRQSFDAGCPRYQPTVLDMVHAAEILSDICYYDSASRGPLGSISLLVRLRYMYLAFILLVTSNFLTYSRHIASLGAFIAIAALALDPFF